jgi:hypothetical protein
MSFIVQEVAHVLLFLMYVHQMRRIMITQKTGFYEEMGQAFDHFPKYHMKIVRRF